ncbi:hypothetical protein ACFOZ7_01610 [Natribaculum luteum]|uniref:Zinc ribbon domain-containing protein n=1 Tax=Natribaculum luteum TaxID=1586232 RepID=A0ABD5NVQ3_9EURY|nr:hypothetical protein [Natribaculum luteum]
MKWRCTWCGKPHETNDPPCDNCGHGSFERAVVREPDLETVDTGPAYVWTCTDCGRDHVKNSPPCSRCGNPTLEKREQDYADVERDLETPSWLEVAKPYAPIIAVLAVVIGLFATGVVPLSMLPGIGTPTPPDAPGDGEVAAGLDLETVETEIYDRLEDERQTEDAPTRAYDEGLAAFAEYRNRQIVVAHVEDREPDDLPELSDFGTSCSGDVAIGSSQVVADAPAAYENESELAAAVASGLLENRAYRAEALADRDAEAVDVHVGPDDEVFVTYVAC